MELGEDIAFVEIFIFNMHVAAARQPFRRVITYTLACSLRSSQSRVVAIPVRRFARGDGKKLEKYRQSDPGNGDEGHWFEEPRVSRTYDVTAGEGKERQGVFEMRLRPSYLSCPTGC